MSCAWRDERCRIGLILGTGTNACYLEEIEIIKYLAPMTNELDFRDQIVVAPIVAAKSNGHHVEIICKSYQNRRNGNP